MAAATGKRTKASVVKQASINHTSVFLQSLPDKPKEDLSLKEAIAQLGEPIKASLAKGYTYQEIAAMLSDKGIKISAFTLKNYVPSGKRRSGKGQTATKVAARKGQNSTPSLTEAEPKSPNSTSNSKPRGRTPRGTAAKSASSSEATVKEPTSKRGSQATAKPSAKTPISRRRKKVDS